MKVRSDRLASPPVPPTSIPATGPTPWGDRFTLIRMGMAFFLPWPFLTKKLELSAERRALRQRSPSTSRRLFRRGRTAPVGAPVQSDHHHRTPGAQKALPADQAENGIAQLGLPVPTDHEL
jgi:hypothetical protein